jgi:hypothetical protein
MAEIENASGFPHAWFEKVGPGGKFYDVLAVRASYEFSPQHKILSRCEIQPPIEYSDTFEGPAEEDPLKAVILREGNLVLFKPTTDIHVVGTAMSEDSKPKRSWLAALAVGQLRKVLSVCGPRQFERGLLGWRIASPEPVTSVPMDYRYAFGGCFTTEASEDVPAEYVYKRDNPAGCGWLPDDRVLKSLSKPARKSVEQRIAAMKTMQAPQIEDPNAPVTHPDQSLPTQGLAPMARWCAPRLSHAGTYDDRWLEQRYPHLPDDFDPKFYQSAHPDLICPQYLTGDERVGLLGLLPEGAASFALPGLRMLAASATDTGVRRAGPMVLDTVEIDLDTRRVGLVWRAAFERNDPIRRVAVGAIESEMLATEMRP